MQFTSSNHVEQITLFDIFAECIEFNEQDADIKLHNGMRYCDVSAVVPEDLEEGSDKFREYAWAVLVYHKCYYPEAADLLKKHLISREPIRLRLFLSLAFRPDHVVEYL